MSAASHSPDDPRELMLRYLDGTLPAADVSRLNARLQANPTLRRDFAGLLLQQVQLTELGHEARAAALAEEPTRKRRSADKAVRAPGESPWSVATPRIAKPLIRWRAPLALAASIALLFSLGVWFFGPTMGKPVVVEVRGADATIERGTEFIHAAVETALQPGDVLRTGTNATVALAFGRERTRLDLSVSSELKLASLDSGKRFHLSSGKLEADVARQRPFKPMIVTTPNAQARVIGTQFMLTATTNRTQLDVAEGQVRLTDTSNDQAVKVLAGQYAVVAAATELAALPQTGWIFRDYWTNLPGKFVQTLDFSALPDPPHGCEWMNRLETTNGWGENYAARWRGYLHPPVSGRYEISLSASDEALLLLSRDDQPKHSAGLIAQKTQNTQSFELEAGKRYYIEVLHKADEGLDYLSLSWKRPDGKVEIVGGEYLSPFKPKPKETKP